MTNILSLFLSNKKAYYFLFFVACFFRCLHEYNFPWVESDYGVLIEAAKNFTQGHGFSLAHANPSDFSDVQYKPLLLWPVGYSMFLIIPYYITGSWIAAAILLQCIGVIALIFVLLKLLLIFEVKQSIRSFFLIFIAFAPTPFFHLAATDLYTSVFFMFCLYLCIRDYKNGIFFYKTFTLIAILSAVNCFLRYASIPNLLIFPCFYLLLAIVEREKKFCLASLYILMLSSILVVLFFAEFKIDNTRTNFLTNLQNMNLYYEHLKWFDPFPIKALFFIRPIEFRLPVNHLLLIKSFRWAMNLISLLILFFCFYYVFKMKWLSCSKLRSSNFRVMFSFLAVVIISTIGITSFLILQSLTTPPESNSFGPPWMPQFWTFVYSTRYFVLPMIFILLLFFKMLDEERKSIFNIVAAVILSVSFIYSVGYWVYLNNQIFSKNGNGGGAYRIIYSDNYEFYKILKSESGLNENVYFVSHTFGKNAPAATFSGAIPCREYEQIISMNSFKSPNNSKLFLQLPLESQLSEEEKLFLQLHNPELILRQKQSVIYKLNLK